MTATVRPREDLFIVGLMAGHSGCQDADGNYKPDGKNERAELWEAVTVWQPLGTDIWYRFDMFVDASVPPDADRLVIGQWKQNNGPEDASPVLAQRFNGRTFTITIEQNNDDPARDPADTQCRIFVAAQASSPKQPGSGDAHSLIAPLLFQPPLHEAPLSIGHDSADVSHTFLSNSGNKLAGCSRDISVENFHPLPDPFGKWTMMVFHHRVLADGNGLVEIWANGQKISRTTGRIGFRPSTPNGKQYFKFGPYRNHAAYVTTTRLSRYLRSTSRAEVDPDGTLAPE